MNVSTTVNRYKPILVNPLDVPPGWAYSWGDKSVSYLRVPGGSVCLTNWDFVPTSHPHFREEAGRWVELATTADLTITYEG